MPLSGPTAYVLPWRYSVSVRFLHSILFLVDISNVVTYHPLLHGDRIRKFQACHAGRY